VDVKAFEGQLQFGHVGLGGTDFGVVGGADELRDDGGGQNADDDHHDHDLDEGKSVGALLVCPDVHLGDGGLSCWMIEAG
jgi:hypothetical protein